jgi:hypothetical protein
MSYELAQKCFDENVRLATPHSNERTRMMEWNLNAGLARLAEALSQDVGHLEAQIAALRSEIQQLRKGQMPH